MNRYLSKNRKYGTVDYIVSNRQTDIQTDRGGGRGGGKGRGMDGGMNGWMEEENK